MYCRECGAANPEGSRFCGDCGAVMAADGGRMLRPAPQPGALVRVPATSTAVGPPVLRPCPQCGAVMVVPYFHRAMNVVKLLVATCLWFAPAVFYFFIRKDRLVCSGCGAVRGSEGDLAALQAIQVEPRPASGGTALTLAPRDAEAETALVQARAKERSAIVLASMAVGFCALSLISGGMALPAAVAGAAALIPFFRGRALRRKGDLGRRRHETLRILELAAIRHGRLSVTDVAASLQMDLQEAEAALDRMVDGKHVDIDVDDEGHVTYLFPELAGH